MNVSNPSDFSRIKAKLLLRLIKELIMLNNDELQELVEDLHSEDLSMRVATLETLQKYPSSDERVLQYIEALLDDKTLCVLMLPYRFGEIRWLAAQALAAERASLGNE